MILKTSAANYSGPCRANTVLFSANEFISVVVTDNIFVDIALKTFARALMKSHLTIF